MIDVKFDNAKWGKLMAEYAAMGQVSAAGAVTMASRIWLRAAIRLTVPSGPGAELNKTSVQKKLGEKLVMMDSSKLFQEWSELRPKLKSARIADAVTKYTGEKMDFRGAGQILKNAGLHFAGVISKPRRQLHDARKNKRGHIRNKTTRFLVVNDGSVKSYTDAQLKMVGFAKSGWNKAAIALRVKMPAWVRRHNGNGVFRGGTFGNKPFIEFGNAVDHANKNGREDKVMDYSFQFAARQFQKSINVYFNELKKGNAAKLRAKIQADTFSAIEA